MQADNANFQELLLQFRPKSDNLFEEEIFSYAPCTGSETLQRFETEVLQQLAARLGIQGGVHNIFLYEKVHRNNKDVFVGRSAGIIYEKILSVTSGQATFEHEFPSGDRE